MLAAQRRGEMLFAEEMRKPDAEVDFVRAAAFVAMHRRPELSRVEDAVEELDELAAELEKLLPPNEEDRFPLRTLKTISRFMFEDLGFRGDDETFYDPRNSCLDEVLARRVGIPITLSLIYMELAKRVGMPMVGVNLPSRFMIRPVVDEMEVLVDVFNKGEIVFVEDVEEMLGKFYSGAGNASSQNGDDASVPSSGPSEDPPSVQITIDRAFFEDNSVRPKQFFTRMLTNLKQIYFNEEAYADALRVVGYQAHCAPTAEIERFNRRDGGICLFLMQRYDECVEELNGYLEDAAAAAAAEDAEAAAATTSEEREALASRRAARDRDRAQVTRMVHTALEQSKRLAAEKAVTNTMEGKEKDEGDDDRNRLDDEKADAFSGNERKRKDTADLDDEAFRIVEDALRRADEREDEEKE
jgi:regulator of sirC expression with transglutaminase-like and TPR domain